MVASFLGVIKEVFQLFPNAVTAYPLSRQTSTVIHNYEDLILVG